MPALILTHEQADFDAVAAQLAAWCLEPAAVPVLPKRLNRNVRSFLSLYGAELPFVALDELPRAKVSRVILVDTQTLPSIRGVTEATAVHVVDHHTPSAELPPGWTSAIQPVGATTTLLVESLSERDGLVTPVQATLLLLGIYEDTGSLLYASTDHRDAYVAGWLMERGASLDIAAKFLHHPLTPDQRELFERLLESSETYDFHGQAVVVAAAEGGALVEEISTVAHQLRDLLDPAALILAVSLNAHVQLVARSTSDSIDVSKLAEHFGGGGHSRAAAALVRDRRLGEVRDEVLRILPEHVRPRVVVGQIMSRGPQLLSPRSRVAEAAERMERYGYEGYPVAEGGKVVGLLTRRAVDRALGHKMGNAPVSSVMEGGEFSVRVEDSIERLQQVMMESGWGQVPVVSAEGQIVGIVTRTDLLKALGGLGWPAGAGRRNLADALERALPPARLALLKVVGDAGRDLNLPVYIVGGFVRDLLLGHPAPDFDFVVEGEAIALARAMARRFGGRVTAHARFGTAKWVLAEERQGIAERLLPEAARSEDTRPLPDSIDFVSARREFYASPSALPQVERGSIKLDLHRRDFTINTLALRLDGAHYGELLDFWGGERDLREGVVRVLHSISFVDDATRMLRAVRLEQRLGFRIEPRTLELMEHALPLLERVSGDRVRHELEFIFREADPGRILARLDELGVLTHLHPSLGWDDWLGRKFERARTVDPSVELGIERTARPTRYFGLWFCRLHREDLRQVMERLKFAKEQSRLLVETNALFGRLGDLARMHRPSDAVALLSDYSEGALGTAWLAADDEAAREKIRRYLGAWRQVSPVTTGDGLRAMGLRPGPVYGRILWALTAAWLDGEVQSAEEEDALLEALVNDAVNHDRDVLPE